MGTGTDQERHQPSADLAAEGRRLRGELEQTTKRSGTGLLATFFAALLGLAALVGVAFRINHDQNTVNAMHERMSTGQMTGNMAAGTGGATTEKASGATSAGAAHQVTAELGDY